MLLLQFRSGETHYGIDAGRVVEVVPRVEFRPIPHSPDYLLGLLKYRGRVVPVIDFSSLIGQQKCRDALSSRVIIMEFMAEVGQTRLLGLLAESVSRVQNVATEQQLAPPMDLEDAPYLEAVYTVKDALIQLVVTDKLLSERMRTALFGSAEDFG